MRGGGEMCHINEVGGRVETMVLTNFQTISSPPLLNVKIMLRDPPLGKIPAFTPHHERNDYDE